MEFEFSIVKEDEWSDLTDGNLSETDIFGKIEFLKIITDLYKINYRLFSVSYKGKPIIMTYAIANNKNIIIPNYFYFQFFSFSDKAENSWIGLEGMDFLIQNLKKTYNNISIRLPVGFNDVRPFLWNDFTANIKYTYIKELSDLSYHQNTHRILKKKDTDFSFKKNEDWELVWKHHEKNLRTFTIGYRVKNYLEYFKQMKETGVIETYNAYSNGVFISSIITITDKHTKKAYFPLIGTVDGFYNSGLAVKLYDYTLSELKSSGIEEVDLYGANMKSIARFKSKFNPELVCFYEVRYSKRKDVLKVFISKLKHFMSKYI